MKAEWTIRPVAFAACLAVSLGLWAGIILLAVALA